jgi:fructokinase
LEWVVAYAEEDVSDACAFLVCGEALIDLVPVDDGSDPLLRAVCGGSPYNVAIGLGRLGAETHFLGRLSHDANGGRLARRLSENGVGVGFVAFGAAPSTLAYVFPPEPGRPDVGYAFYVDGTSGATLQPEDFPRSLPAHVRIVHFGSFSALLPRSGAMIRDFAAGSGCLVSYDPNVRPTITPDRDAGRQEIAACIAVADIVKLSDADAEWLYPGRPLDDIAGDILRLGPSLIAITRGADGAIVQTPTMRVAVPGVPTRVIDTVGAGDTFMAALLWGLGQRGLVDRRALASAGEADLTGAASVACRAAAIVCARPGADPPFAAELEGSAAG